MEGYSHYGNSLLGRIQTAANRICVNSFEPVSLFEGIRLEFLLADLIICEFYEMSLAICCRIYFQEGALTPVNSF